MREIEIEGTKAGYARLKTMGQLHEYGLQLTPEATAPFQVRWDPAVDAACVCLNQTRIAEVNISGPKPILHIIDAYPAAHDSVLIRALRNAASMTDHMAKLAKAEGKSRGPLFTTTRDQITVPMDGPTFHKAMLGAEIVDPRLRISTLAHVRPCYQIIAHAGKIQHKFEFEHVDGVMVSRPVHYATYAMKAEPFLALLAKGLRIWESRFSADALTASLRGAPAINTINVGQIETSYDLLSRGDGTFVDPHTVTRVGEMTFTRNTQKQGYGEELELRFRDLRVMTEHHSRKADLPDGYARDHKDLLAGAFKAMSVMWKAEAMGHKLEDYPAFDVAVVEKMIEDTHFGYDF